MEVREGNPKRGCPQKRSLQTAEKFSRCGNSRSGCLLIVQNPCAGDGTAVLEHLDHHAHAEGEAIDKIVRVIQLFEVALCVTILVQEPDLLLIQTVAQLLFLFIVFERSMRI